MPDATGLELIAQELREADADAVLDTVFFRDHAALLVAPAAVPLAQLGAPVPPSGAVPQPEKIRLPTGFSIAVWASKVPGARSMSLAPDGTVFVGTMQKQGTYMVAVK